MANLVQDREEQIRRLAVCSPSDRTARWDALSSKKLHFKLESVRNNGFFPISSNTVFFGACVVTRISCGTRTHNLRADCLIDIIPTSLYPGIQQSQEITGGFEDSCFLVGWWFVLFLLTPFFYGKNVHPISPVAPRTEISTAEQLLRAELTEREREVGLKKSEKVSLAQSVVT